MNHLRPGTLSSVTCHGPIGHWDIRHLPPFSIETSVICKKWSVIFHSIAIGIDLDESLPPLTGGAIDNGTLLRASTLLVLALLLHPLQRL